MTECAVMIALATILSLYKIIELPSGGSITALSMVPLIVLSYRNGLKWGVFSGFVFGLIQLLIGISALKGVSAITVVGSFFLDYLLAFGSLGLAGLFKNSKFNPALALGLGAALGTIVRFLCHFISGFLLWSSLVDEGFGAITYSFGYNITYMGPEIVATIVGCVILGGTIAVVGKRKTV